MASEVEIERLLVRLMGDTSNYIKELEKAEKKTTSTVARISQTLDKVGRSMQSMGRTLTTRVTMPLVALGGAAVRAFSTFDQAMVESTAIMNVTAEQINQMREHALDLAKQGTQGPRELAESYYFLASAGMNAEESMQALPEIMKFATAGAFDMAEATDLLTDAQSAFGLTVKGDAELNRKNMVALGDQLVKANTLANASVQQFSEALTNRGAAAFRAFNKDSSEALATLAVMADRGLKGVAAGTSLERLTTLLAKSALGNAEAHDLMGLKIFDASGKMRHMGDIVNNLDDILAGMDDETKALTLDMLGFDARVQSTIKLLLGGGDALKRFDKELDNAGDTTQKVYDEQMKSFSAQVKVLWDQIKVLGIEIGEKLVPHIKTLLSWVEKQIEKWDDLEEGTQETILKMGAFTAAIGPLLTAGGTLLTWAGALIKAIASIKAGVLALIPLMKGKWLAAMLASRAGILGIVAAATYLWAKFMKVDKIAGTMWEKWSKRYGKLAELDKNTRGQAEFMDKLARERGFDDAADMMEKTKHSRENKELEKAKADAEAAQKEAEAAATGGATPSATKTPTPRFTKESILKMKREKELKGKIEETTKALQKQVDTFGKTQIEIQRWELKMAGASDEMLKGFDRASAELQRKRKHQEMMDAAKKQSQTQSNLGISAGRSVAGFGSAEAATRLDQYMFRVRQKTDNKSPEIKLLTNMDKNLERIAAATDDEYAKYLEHTENQEVNQ
jgi:TP901 family phage tail tape measure protein